MDGIAGRICVEKKGIILWRIGSWVKMCGMPAGKETSEELGTGFGNNAFLAWWSGFVFLWFQTDRSMGKRMGRQ